MKKRIHLTETGNFHIGETDVDEMCIRDRSSIWETTLQVPETEMMSRLRSICQRFLPTLLSTTGLPSDNTATYAFLPLAVSVEVARPFWESTPTVSYTHLA